MNIKSSDILSIAIGSIVTDFLFLLMNYNDKIFVSKKLTLWYTDLGTSAMAMDIIIILLVVMLGIKLSEYYLKSPSLLTTSLAVVMLQVLHDVLFYIVFETSPKGIYIFDVFKNYALEVGYHAIWSDSLMVLSTLFIADKVSVYSNTKKQVLLLSSLYIALFSLYSKPPTIP